MIFFHFPSLKKEGKKMPQQVLFQKAKSILIRIFRTKHLCITVSEEKQPDDLAVTEKYTLIVLLALVCTHSQPHYIYI